MPGSASQSPKQGIQLNKNATCTLQSYATWMTNNFALTAKAFQLKFNVLK